MTFSAPWFVLRCADWAIPRRWRAWTRQQPFPIREERCVCAAGGVFAQVIRNPWSHQWRPRLKTDTGAMKRAPGPLQSLASGRTWLDSIPPTAPTAHPRWRVNTSVHAHKLKLHASVRMQPRYWLLMLVDNNGTLFYLLLICASAVPLCGLLLSSFFSILALKGAVWSTGVMM